MNQRLLPEFVDISELKALCRKVLDLAVEGLKKRGYGEEVYLESIYKRADSLMSPAKAMAEGISSGRSMTDFIYEYAKL